MRLACATRGGRRSEAGHCFHLLSFFIFGPGVLACATRGGGRSEAGHCFPLLFFSFFFSSFFVFFFHQHKIMTLHEISIYSKEYRPTFVYIPNTIIQNIYTQCNTRTSILELSSALCMLYGTTLDICHSKWKQEILNPWK